MQLWASTYECMMEHAARRKAVSAMPMMSVPGLVITRSDTLSSLTDGVAIIDVFGDLADRMEWWQDGCQYSSIIDRLYAVAGASPLAIVLHINSRGGTVSGSIECHAAIVAFREAFPDIPVVAHIDGIGASAACLIASACEYVTASPTALVGSLGVIAERLDLSAAQEKDGIAVHVMTVGSAKADGNPSVPMSSEEAMRFKERLDQAAEMLYSAVESSRPALAGKVRGLQAQLVMAAQALEWQLIDEVSTLDDVVMGLLTA